MFRATGMGGWVARVQLSISDEFKQMVELFKPIMHLMLLIWKRSMYYNSPARLVVLIREICNDLIKQASSFLGGAEIMQDEPQVAVDKLKTTLQVSGRYARCLPVKFAAAFLISFLIFFCLMILFFFCIGAIPKRACLVECVC